MRIAKAIKAFIILVEFATALYFVIALTKTMVILLSMALAAAVLWGLHSLIDHVIIELRHATKVDADKAYAKSISGGPYGQQAERQYVVDSYEDDMALLNSDKDLFCKDDIHCPSCNHINAVLWNEDPPLSWDEVDDGCSCVIECNKCKVKYKITQHGNRSPSRKIEVIK